MELAAELVHRHFSVQNGELCIGGLPVSSIVEKFGTPAFIYDQSVLERRLADLRRILPAAFHVSYSVKANPAQAILRFFLARGCGLEIASGGELEQALAAGCPANRIIFAGPGKTATELELALHHGIKEIHVESAHEIARISQMCRQLSCQASIAIRVNPCAEAQGGAMRMGGKPAPFGIDEECVEPIVAKVLQDPRLIFRGIQLFTGTQILDHAILVTQYRKAIEIARQIASKFNCPIHTIDFGGGLGIPYFAGEQPLDLEQLHGELDSLGMELQNDPILSGTELMIEPGRFLVGEAGIYVARVNDIKVSRGKKFLIIDGGMNHHLAASGNLGQTIKRNYPFALLNKIGAPAVENGDVVGPLCTPLDVVARNAHFPPAEIGDLVGIFQSGAYARSASPLGFLSHPTPPEILVSNQHASIIRARGESSQYLLDQSISPLQQ